MRDIRMMQHAAAEQTELRSLDAEVHALMHGTPIEWRVCATDPETGRWEDVQWHDEQPKVGDIIWLHSAVSHPCYNRLDAKKPRERGWSDADIADHEARERRWLVVPFYATQDGPAFAAVDWMREQGWTFCLYDYLIVESIPTDQKWQAVFIGKGISPACSASTRPLAIAKAMKKALGAK